MQLDKILQHTSQKWCWIKYMLNLFPIGPNFGRSYLSVSLHAVLTWTASDENRALGATTFTNDRLVAEREGWEGHCPSSGNRFEIMRPIIPTEFVQFCGNWRPESGAFSRNFDFSNFFQVFIQLFEKLHNEKIIEKITQFKEFYLKKLSIRQGNVLFLWKHWTFYFLCKYKFLPLLNYYY